MRDAIKALGSKPTRTYYHGDILTLVHTGMRKGKNIFGGVLKEFTKEMGMEITIPIEKD